MQEPIEANGCPGYYEIPEYSRYIVSRDGKVFNRISGEHLEGSTNPDGYHNFRLTSDIGYTLTWGRHRLLAFVFKHPNCLIERLTVNHENGVKGDDRLENLEWMTQQAQQEHAGRTGLTRKCLPIAVRDVDTGKVIEYPSIVEYARLNGLTKDAVNYRIKSGQEKVFPERKQYRLAEEKGEWIVPDDIERALLLNSTSKRVKVRFLMLGLEREFSQLSEMAEYLDIKLPTISTWMDRPNQPVLPGFIQIKLASDVAPWRDVTDPYLELEQTTGKRAVVVNDLVRKSERVFTSAVECAGVMGLSPTALSHRLKSQGSKLYPDGCTYAYYADHCNKNSSPAEQ